MNEWMLNNVIIIIQKKKTAAAVAVVCMQLKNALHSWVSVFAMCWKNAHTHSHT